MKFRGRYDFLSNFYPCAVHHQGYTWPSAEHAYQGWKCGLAYQRDMIQTAVTPADAKAMGRSVILRQDFTRGRIAAMREIIAAKFNATTQLARLLVEVEEPIVETNYWADRFWGADLQGVGENHLGKILAAQREHLIQSGVGPPTYNQRETEQRAQWKEADQEDVWFPEAE